MDQPTNIKPAIGEVLQLTGMLNALAGAATVTLTLSDTPTGGVAIHSDFRPAIGQPVTPCQQHALDMIARTHRQWGIDKDYGGTTLPDRSLTQPQHHPG